MVRYQLQGVFGTVLICEKLETGKQYAVKVVRLDEDIPEIRMNASREYQLLTQLDHSNIVKPVALFVNVKESQLVMQLIEGVTITKYFF